ncbi:MAG: DUF1566 domain-containing protein [Desulforegulaceae bacterium]|nr:DUF1566 domain-containing protein [Desulforegulaceae bacterium]
MEFKKIFLFAAILILMPCLCFSSDFTDNGDGTITDNKTGLMWMKETADNKMNWKDALSYCENLDYAGYSDWRLPNIKELGSIVDYSAYNPAIDTNFFPDTMSSYYWSSTTYSYGAVDAWRVYFDYGSGHGPGNKSNTYYVRAVRGGQ